MKVQLILIIFVLIKLHVKSHKALKSHYQQDQQAIGSTLHGIPSNYPHAYQWSPHNHTFVPLFIRIPPNSDSLKPGFLAFQPQISFRSFSEVQQDTIVTKIFDHIKGGYFIDLAANDWIKWSNTYALEYFYHWDGICIEPSWRCLVGLLANRRCKVFTNPVTSQTGEIVTFRYYGGEDALSGIVSEVEELDHKGKSRRGDKQLMSTTLTDVLNFAQAPKTINYMSLDVEGSEYLVMKGFNFSEYTILLLSVERPKVKLHKLLTQNHYIFLFQVGEFGDCFYIHETISNKSLILQAYKQKEVPRWNREKKEYLLEESVNFTENGNIHG